jgi:phenylacetate-coenzyme A ligase PaaK-like adenylate-forming protein
LRLEKLEDVERLPFTDENDLMGGIEDFLCVPPEEISRIVSLFTSGSTGAPKRIGFTGEDLEATVRYFTSGMSQMTGPGKRTMICMPGKSEYGVAHLLSLGIGGFGGLPVVYGTVSDPEDAARFMADLKPHCIVGIPVQVLALAEQYGRRYRESGMEAVLLSADYAADSLKTRIRDIFRCQTLNHYGSTEMGYGAALECAPLGGLHIRAADLFFEIVDPDTGKSAGPGEEGELVFTTLTRRGMPLIRYRTGDFARFLPDRCECGQVAPRFTRPWRRKGGAAALGGRRITLPELDEIMFSNGRVADYSASIHETREGGAHIALTVWSVRGESADADLIRKAVKRFVPNCADIEVTIAPEGETSPGLQGKRVLQTGECSKNFCMLQCFKA